MTRGGGEAAAAVAGSDGAGALEFWDCHAAVGRWTLPPPAGALEPDALRAELARERRRTSLARSRGEGAPPRATLRR